MNLLFPYGTAAHLVGVGGFVITLWLGAYLTTNAPRSFPSRLAILSLFEIFPRKSGQLVLAFPLETPAQEIVSDLEYLLNQ